MNEQQPSQIFGLHFLQDMKGTAVEITGAYDPEQELWIMQGQVQGSPLPGWNRRILGQLPGHQQFPGPPRRTTQTTREHTLYETITNNYQDNDEASDTDTDTERD